MVNVTHGIPHTVSTHICWFWLVVDLPLWKISKVSWDNDIPNIWKNKIHVPNHQPVYMVPFIINIPPMLAYIYICIYTIHGEYMEHMGNKTMHAPNHQPVYQNYGKIVPSLGHRQSQFGWVSQLKNITHSERSVMTSRGLPSGVIKHGLETPYTWQSQYVVN